MVRLTHTPDHLTVRDSPGCFWILGVFFIAVSSVFVLAPLGLFVNAAEVAPLERILAFAMGCIGVGVGIYILDSSPLSRATFDRQRVEIKRSGLFRRSTASYPLADIASLDIAESRDSDGDLTYQLHLTLRSGQHVPISSLWM